jgi:hypothetical protein
MGDFLAGEVIKKSRSRNRLSVQQSVSQSLLTLWFVQLATTTMNKIGS